MRTHAWEHGRGLQEQWGGGRAELGAPWALGMELPAARHQEHGPAPGTGQQEEGEPPLAVMHFAL